MAARTVYNTTDSPVVIDAEGRVLPGRTRDELPATAELAAALRRGDLVDVTPAKPRKGSDAAPTATGTEEK